MFVLFMGKKNNKITKKQEFWHFLIKSICKKSVSASAIKNIVFATLPPSRVWRICLAGKLQGRYLKATKRRDLWATKAMEGSWMDKNEEPLRCNKDRNLWPLLVIVLNEHNEELEKEENTDQEWNWHLSCWNWGRSRWCPCHVWVLIPN